MKREVPLLLTFLFGAFFILSNFIAWEGWKTVADNVNNWVLVVIAFTYVLGVGNLLRIHGLKISRQESGWGYSLTTIIGLLVMLVFGLLLWFLPQTEGSGVFRFRALKAVEPQDAVHVSAPVGSGDLFDVRLGTAITLDTDQDGTVGPGDEIECRLTYSYLGSESLPAAVFMVTYDPSALASLDTPPPPAAGAHEASGTAGAAAPGVNEQPEGKTAAGTAPDATGSKPSPAGTPGAVTPESPAAPASPADGEASSVAASAALPASPAEGDASSVAAPAALPTPPPGRIETAPGGFVWNAGAIRTSLFGTTRAGTGQTSVYTWFYDAVYVPMQSTMFALLAFFISSAAFRAFRVRSANAVLLGVAALVVILGSVPVGEAVWQQFPTLVAWVMNCLQTAGKRAILIGAALGAIATGLKMIVGAEKGYLSRD